MSADLNRAGLVLSVLNDEGPMTADEFVAERGWYVNSWAPVFTQLRQAGLVKRTGQKRATIHGSDAWVIAITTAGRQALREIGARV